MGFIHLYDYILKSTDDDYELIDQLFFVPGRFEREFQQLNFSYKNVSLLKNDIYEISVLGRRVVLCEDEAYTLVEDGGHVYFY